MPLVFATVAVISWSLSLADIGPNTTQVLLAFIGALSSTLTALLIGRERRDRKRGQAEIRDSIRDKNMVALVPGDVMRDVATAEKPPAVQTSAHGAPPAPPAP